MIRSSCSIVIIALMTVVLTSVFSSTCPEDQPCELDFFTTCHEFKRDFWKKKPGILRESSLKKKEEVVRFRDATTREALESSPLSISLSTSVSYTGRVYKTTRVSDYVKDDSPVSQLGNETFYLFGNHEGADWEEFLNEYPKLEESEEFSCLGLDPQASSLSFGCAREGTGVPFHFHGDGFLQVLVGSKMWFLAPPEMSNEMIGFDPNITTRDWFHNNYPARARNLQRCTLLEGDIIYFPPMWKHATYNTGQPWNSWMSTFL